MKKQSVLIQRALLFTAIVLTAAIAVGLPTGLLLSRNAAVRAARQELLPEVRLMAAAAQSGDGALHTSAELFGAAGGVAWLAADGQTVQDINDLMAVRRTHIADETITLTVLRDGRTFEAAVTLYAEAEQ